MSVSTAKDFGHEYDHSAQISNAHAWQSYINDYLSKNIVTFVEAER